MLLLFLLITAASCDVASVELAKQSIIIAKEACPSSVNPVDVVFDPTPPDHYTPEDINAQLPRDVALLRDLGIDDIEDLTVAEKVARYVIQSPEMFSERDTEDLMAVASALHKKLLIVWESGEEFLPIATMEVEPGRGQTYSDAVRSIHSVMSDALLQWRLLVRSYFVVEERDDGSKVLHRYFRRGSGIAQYHTAKMQTLGSKTELELLQKKAGKTVAKAAAASPTPPVVVEIFADAASTPQDYRMVTYIVGGFFFAVAYVVLRLCHVTM